VELIPPGAETRIASWRVFALVLFSSAYFFQSTAHNEAARLDQVRSIAERGEWWIDAYAFNTADSIKIGDHIYPNKAPGVTLLGIVPWAAARGALSFTAWSEEQQLILSVYLLTLLLASLPTALTSLLLVRFLAGNAWNVGVSTLLGLGYGLGTIAFPWSTVLFGHQLAAFLAFGGFYLIWAGRGPSGRDQDLRVLAAGVLLGFLPVVEYPGAIATGLVAVYALVTMGRRAFLILAAGAILGALPLPLYNQLAFGDAGVLSYSFYRDGGAFPGHRAGILGVSWPRWDVFLEIAFKTQRGLFYANPWLAASLLAPFFLRRNDGVTRELALSLSMLAAFFLFNAGFGNTIVYWGGAASFGPRHMLTAVPFAALLAAFPMRAPRAALLIGALIVVTALLMVPVTAIDPRFPYEPAEPFLGFYLPFFTRGHFSLNPESTFEETAIFATTGAFSLGRAIGLPKSLEILPLTLVWAVAAMRMFPVGTGFHVNLRRLSVAAISALGLLPFCWSFRTTVFERPGWCRAVSTERWPHLAGHAWQDEPSSSPAYKRVPVAVLAPGSSDTKDQPDAQGLAVTFSGYFEPPQAGWYLLRIDGTGEAALYLNGLRRASFAERPPGYKRNMVQVYLAKERHELMVRSMAAEAALVLSLSITTRDGAFVPFDSASITSVCPH
jgi:hypothetical protein